MRIDSRPLKRVAFCAAAGVVALTASVEAAKTPVLFYDKGTVIRPSSLDASKITTSSGGPPYDETIYRAKRLRWKGWGTSKAIGRGRITYCVIDYRKCRTKRGEVRLSQVWTNGCGDLARRSYRYVQWRFPGSPSAKIEAMPYC